jgi:hypothetical protein
MTPDVIRAPYPNPWSEPKDSFNASFPAHSMSKTTYLELLRSVARTRREKRAQDYVFGFSGNHPTSSVCRLWCQQHKRGCVPIHLNKTPPFSRTIKGRDDRLLPVQIVTVVWFTKESMAQHIKVPKIRDKPHPLPAPPSPSRQAN